MRLHSVRRSVTKSSEEQSSELTEFCVSCVPTTLIHHAWCTTALMLFTTVTMVPVIHPSVAGKVVVVVVFVEECVCGAQHPMRRRESGGGGSGGVCCMGRCGVHCGVSELSVRHWQQPVVWSVTWGCSFHFTQCSIHVSVCLVFSAHHKFLFNKEKT